MKFCIDPNSTACRHNSYDKMISLFRHIMTFRWPSICDSTVKQPWSIFKSHVTKRLQTNITCNSSQNRTSQHHNNVGTTDFPRHVKEMLTVKFAIGSRYFHIFITFGLWCCLGNQIGERKIFLLLLLLIFKFVFLLKLATQLRDIIIININLK